MVYCLSLTADRSRIHTQHPEHALCRGALSAVWHGKVHQSGWFVVVVAVVVVVVAVDIVVVVCDCWEDFGQFTLFRQV